MKTVTDTVTAITRRLERTWQDTLAPDAEAEPAWPYDVPLGPFPSAEEFAAKFESVTQQVAELREFARQFNLDVRDTNRRVFNTRQPLPSHVTVDHIDTAARIAGSGWDQRLARNRHRRQQLIDRQFAAAYDPAVLRGVDKLTDDDWTLTLTVAEWRRDYTGDLNGMTPRQVPVPGVHAKFLNTGIGLIERITGKELSLEKNHASRVFFTYLDPEYLADPAHRRYDMATVGDVSVVPYSPHLVVISENKDTAVNFPLFPGGIAVEGAGKGMSALAAIPWLSATPNLLYWGDIDEDGFAILNEARAAGLPVQSMLMNLATYATYSPFGTMTNKDGKLLVPERRTLPHLTIDEQKMYHLLTDEKHDGPRRIEQERIPLDVALKEAQRLTRPPC